jgi:hypothetical protein
MWVVLMAAALGASCDDTTDTILDRAMVETDGYLATVTCIEDDAYTSATGSIPSLSGMTNLVTIGTGVFYGSNVDVDLSASIG